MGIVRKILGDEKLTKTDLISIKDEEKAEADKGPKKVTEFESKKSAKLKSEAEEPLTTSDLVPKGIEMFVRIDDYKAIVSQLRKLDAIVSRLEGLERAHAEIQDINDKFVEQLEMTLGDIEEVKDHLGTKLKIPDRGGGL